MILQLSVKNQSIESYSMGRGNQRKILLLFF